jgi:hypothetical protein
MFLVAAVLLSGCENDQLLEEDFNQYQENTLGVLKGPNEIKTNKSNDINSLNLNHNIENLNTIGSNGFNNILDIEGVLEVYVDFTNIVDQDNGTILLMSEVSSIDEYIMNYENDLGNDFTIYGIVQSTNCDYVYKWIVNEIEYFVNGPGSTSGINAVIHRPKSDTPEDPIDGITYNNCF